MDGFLTIPEFLKLYPMGRSSLYRLVNQGDLRLLKIGRSSRITRADAQAWADRLTSFEGASNSTVKEA